MLPPTRPPRSTWPPVPRKTRRVGVLGVPVGGWQHVRAGVRGSCVERPDPVPQQERGPRVAVACGRPRSSARPGSRRKPAHPRPPGSPSRPTPRPGWRSVSSRPATREHYRWLLDEHLIPAFGKPAAGVDHLRRCTDLARPVRHRHPTVRSHAYGLARTILGTAASDGKIGANPCVIRGAGATKRKHTIRPASLPELAKLTGAMPEPYQA